MPEGLFTFYDLYVIDDLEKKELYICTGERLHSYEWYESELSELAGMPDRQNAGPPDTGAGAGARRLRDGLDRRAGASPRI